MEPDRAPLAAAAMDAEFQRCIGAAAEIAVERSPAAGAGGVVRLPSRAIHDASPVSTVMPAAMMFVPSIGGVSHTFDEHTHDDDIAAGALAFVGAAAGIVLQSCGAAAAAATNKAEL